VVKGIEMKTKTDIIRQHAIDNNLTVIDVLCNSADIKDYRGLPMTDEQYKLHEDYHRQATTYQQSTKNKRMWSITDTSGSISDEDVKACLDILKDMSLDLWAPITMMTIKDDGKRFNVWNKAANRWTNRKVDGSHQDPKSPDPLNFTDATDLLQDIQRGEPSYSSNYEIRELNGSPKETEHPTLPEIQKPAGMKCSGGCDEFNNFAEANQSNGTFICYSCRKR
jgi:hypothetical protein